MSWHDLYHEPDRDKAAAAKDHAAQVAAKQQAACERACKDPTFRTMLRNVAMGRSYLQGRDATAVAYAEGYRALALEILTQAKVTNDG